MKVECFGVSGSVECAKTKERSRVQPSERQADAGTLDAASKQRTDHS